MVTILTAVIISPNATASASTPPAAAVQSYSTSAAVSGDLAPVPAASWGDVLRVAGSYLECEAIRMTMGPLRFLTMCVPGSGRSYLLVFI